jgi:hypothetical protein
MVNLKISPEKAILLLNAKVDEIETMRKNQTYLEYYDFIGWCSNIWSVIDEIYPADDFHPEEIRVIGGSACSCNSPGGTQMLLETYQDRLADYISEIQRSVKIPEYQRDQN